MTETPNLRATMHNLCETVYQTSLFVEKYSMMAFQSMGIVIISKHALESLGTSFKSVTGSELLSKNVDWLFSSFLVSAFTPIAIHVFSLSVFLLAASTFTKCITCAFLDRQVTWENWHFMVL